MARDSVSAASATATPSAAVASSPGATPTLTSNYVGLRFDPKPAGVSYEGGAVLPGPDGKPSLFALDHFLTPKGNYLWLDSLLPSDGEHGLHRRVVRAELHMDPMTSGHQLYIGSCSVAKKFDPSIVAVAEARMERAKPVKMIVQQAWRADPATSRFVVVPPDGITCEDVVTR